MVELHTYQVLHFLAMLVTFFTEGDMQFVKPADIGAVPYHLANQIHAKLHLLFHQRLSICYSSSSSLYTYQTTVTYSCEDGYKMMSNDTIACNADGTWDAITIDCRLQECMLPSVSGELTYSFNSLRHNSQIRFTCPDGFFLNGSSSATCTADGVWDHPIPSCERIKCPSIVRPSHSRVNGDGVFYKDAIKFTCNPGYHLHGAADINCTISGEWSSAAPTCKPMACMKPPDIEFGVPLIDKSYKPNEMILYRCTSGYSLEGMTRRRCQKDGSWTGREPSCKEGSSSHGPAAVKAPPICVVPCLNGGVCTGNYQCLCRYGYSGFRCEIAQCKPRCIGNAKCARRNRQCSE
ncbi:putative sushi, von Willebrand factor type A [Apostichopus japonicus]|uniref:Putative sushi, von Willebrand factor type A n=1 Tax=Stichopus japonicus TaxID=307972 RepID=A0A2G8K3F7_STIJA|nr:putative sushi, von Willebrand factor type A [Apostichopus japonicus]